jgi:Xaa-Pro aminopeptidase
VAGRHELLGELMHVHDHLLLRLLMIRSDLQHGTGHGVGSFLNVHEGLHGFSSQVPLTPGHVLTNEPGYCKSYPP